MKKLSFVTFDELVYKISSDLKFKGRKLVNDDIRFYLPILSPDEISSIRNAIQKAMDSDDNKFIASIKALIVYHYLKVDKISLFEIEKGNIYKFELNYPYYSIYKTLESYGN